MLVFFNGKIIEEESAKIGINDLAYQFGYGLFETMQARDGKIFFFEDHFKRLKKGSDFIKMNFPIAPEELKKWILDLLSANKSKSARIKIILSKKIEDGNEKFNLLILSSALEKEKESFSLISKNFLIQNPLLRHKTTNRLEYFLLLREAQSEGFDDAICFNEKNEITECTRANVFLVLENKIITPSLNFYILPGVTREKVIHLCKRENILIEEKSVHSLYLRKAKEVFITNAIIGVMPISKIKLPDREYTFKDHQVANKIRSKFLNLIKG